MDWDLLEAGLTSLSIVLATIGWLHAAGEHRHLSRKAHTLNVMLAQDTNPELSGMLDRADDQAALGAKAENHLFTPEIRSALNFYEFLCAAANDETLDCDLMKRTMRFRMLRFYRNMRVLIEEKRVELDNPRIAEDFETFVRKQLKYDEWARDLGAQAAPVGVSEGRPPAG
jgi:hypothetical protein